MRAPSPPLTNTMMNDSDYYHRSIRPQQINGHANKTGNFIPAMPKSCSSPSVLRQTRAKQQNSSVDASTIRTLSVAELCQLLAERISQLGSNGRRQSSSSSFDESKTLSTTNSAGLRDSKMNNDVFINGRDDELSPATTSPPSIAKQYANIDTATKQTVMKFLVRDWAINAVSEEKVCVRAFQPSLKL